MAATFLEVGTSMGKQRLSSFTRRLPEEIREVIVMPRIVGGILQHADQLAVRFENYEPDPHAGLDPPRGPLESVRP